MLFAGKGIGRVALAGGAAVLAVAGAASAAWASGGGYAGYDFDTGQVSLPAAGFPAGHIETDSTNPTAPSGAGAFLNSSTPFGQAFGSSRNRPYALLHLARGRRPSTTEITFDAAPAAGTWGFALGDVDAEDVRVRVYGPGDVHLPISDLGFQGTFNFCEGSPLPSTCRGTRSADVPGWDGATGTLRGNVADTDGASGWFRPTAAVTRIVLTATLNSGIPAYQLWIAAHDQPTAPPHHRKPKPVAPISQVVPADIPVTTSPGEPVTVPVCTGTARDIDVVSGPSHGTVSTDAGNCTATYAPAGSYIGTDSFALKIVEANGTVVTKRFAVMVGLAQTGAYHLPELAAAGAAFVLVGGAMSVGGMRRKRRSS
ncbi:MAG TPA: Ig-like domain-containing protein [Actinospica sp.]|nr:Ig-like domain-containing protein [Actinospica sp.]